MSISSTSAVLAPGLDPVRLPLDAIPVVDFGPLLSGEGEREVADAIGHACRNIGFFYLRNHGVPQSLIDEAFDASRHFFALPAAEKDAVHVRRSRIHRGYFPLFEENTDPNVTADVKEGFDLSRELPEDDPDVIAGNRLYGPNQWPETLPSFEPTMQAYYEALSKLAQRIMRAFALGLDLPGNFFEEKVSKSTALLRLLHYPPQHGRIDEAELGTGAHSDYGCLTILAQDDVGGLQLQNSAGDWISAPPVAGTFVVNIGDLMALWTNDLFAATMHRVINASGRERYSIPFFFHPNYHTRVECLDTCHDARHPPRYAPVIAGEHFLRRLDATYQHRQPD